MGTDTTLILRNTPYSKRLNGRHIQLLREARDELINLAGRYMDCGQKREWMECLDQAGRITRGLVQRQILLRSCGC